MAVIYLASQDGGKTWRQVSADPGSTPMNGWVDGQRALADGSILRTVWGQYLPFYDVPQTGYLQRSRDRGKTWRSPFVFDRNSGLTWPKRCRILRDGRLVIAGGMVPPLRPEDTRDDWGKRTVPALWVSDDQGSSWSGAIPAWNNSSVTGATEEVDFAELSNGDLLAMIRVDATHHRWQTLMKKDGKTWKAEPTQQLWIPHSGQPELLMTREGILLHLATDGIAWTADQGAKWTYLEGQPRTGYYPSSVQLPDGRIFCVYHIGGDNYYGQVDQRIEAITFSLKVVR